MPSKKPTTPEAKSKHAKYMREWLNKNQHRLKEYRKRADLKKSYNITLEQFNEMLVEQGGTCYICHQPETQVHPKSGLPYQLSVDHNHETGQVRRLLCNRCNKGLGMFEDSIELLDKLKMYLKEFSN